MPVIPSTATNAVDLSYVSLIFLKLSVAITYSHPISHSIQQK